MELDSLTRYELNNYRELLRFCRHIVGYGFVYHGSGNITHEDILERYEKSNNRILGFFAPDKKNLFCPDFYYFKIAHLNV